jgi:hypothetical protein
MKGGVKREGGERVVTDNKFNGKHKFSAVNAPR